MGTNCAPELANLVDEAKFIDRVAKVDVRLAALYTFTFRFIDDILIFGDAVPPSVQEYGLNYSETTNKNGSVTFLGANICVKNGFLEMSVFDKAAEWSFPVI